MKFLGQCLSLGHYQPTYQQSRKGFIYFIYIPPMVGGAVASWLVSSTPERAVRV